MHKYPTDTYFGFESLQDFTESTFHTKTAAFSAIASVSSGTLAYIFEEFLGFDPYVGLIMLVLFFVELMTGIRASVQVDKDKFSTEKFARGWVKFGVYLLMVGSAHILATHVQIKPIFGWDFNYYEWIHYTFFNYILINLFISNIENFERLGWDEFVPVIGKLAEFLKVKKPKTKEDEN